MVVKIVAEVGTPAALIKRGAFEDRIIVVRAADEREAQQKSGRFAADCTRSVWWTFRKIVDVWEILDANLEDCTEIYSAIVNREWADSLMWGATVQ